MTKDSFFAKFAIAFFLFTLIVAQFAHASETPRIYSLDELRKRTASESFDARESYHRLLAAKANMRLHYLNLLPHLSMNSITSIATFSGPAGMLTSVGDLVPFLLPSRWAKAKESKYQLKAEELGYRIAREDSLQMLEGISLTISRDQKILRQLTALRPKFAAIIDLVKKYETAGKLSPGRFRNVAYPVNALDQLLATLENAISTELSELAYATGFRNPLAILGIAIEPAGNVAQSDNFNLAALEAQAVQTSLELPQLDELIAAAAANRKGRAFEWLDPTGDPQGGLGFSTPTYIEIASHNVAALRLAKERTQATVRKKVAKAVFDLNTAKKTYDLALQGVAIQNARLENSLEEMRTNPNDTPVGELQDVIEKLSIQVVNATNADYAWQIALSRLHRLTHMGDVYGPAVRKGQN